MIKRSTWILLIILALVIGAYFIIKNRPSKPVEPTPTAIGAQFLIAQPNDALNSIRIENEQGGVIQLQRDPSKAWIVTEPQPGAADQALAGAAETQVGALRIVTTLETPPALNVIGLDSPAFTIQLEFESGTSHKIEVGNMTPTGSGYYVRYDRGNIYVISQSGIDALLNLLKAPPYLPTETPTPTIEVETVTPTLETVTPTAYNGY